MKLSNDYVIGVLVIIIPLILLWFCLKKREEKFINMMGNNSMDWKVKREEYNRYWDDSEKENFINMFGENSDGWKRDEKFANRRNKNKLTPSGSHKKEPFINMLGNNALDWNKRENFINMFGNNAQGWEVREDFLNLGSLGLGLGETKVSKESVFPPEPKYSDLSSTLSMGDGFKEIDNQEFLKSIMPIDKFDNKKLDKRPDLKNKLLNENINKVVKEQKSKDGVRGGVKEMNMTDIPQKNRGGRLPLKKPESSEGFEAGFGTCNFYSNQCPTGYSMMGSFGVNGLQAGMSLMCGDNTVGSTNYGKYVATIRNGSIEKISILENAINLDPKKKYEVRVTAKDSGTGAIIEPIIDDSGKLSVLEIKSGGKGYLETPIVELIEEGLNSQMINGKCVFCCKK